MEVLWVGLLASPDSLGYEVKVAKGLQNRTMEGPGQEEWSRECWSENKFRLPLPVLRPPPPQSSHSDFLWGGKEADGQSQKG